MFYFGSNLVILDQPTEVEMMLARDALEDATIVTCQANTISIKRQGLVEQYPLDTTEPFSRVYLREITTILQRTGSDFSLAQLASSAKIQIFFPGETGTTIEIKCP